jgi:hypothetical protein
MWIGRGPLSLAVAAASAAFMSGSVFDGRMLRACSASCTSVRRHLLSSTCARTARLSGPLAQDGDLPTLEPCVKHIPHHVPCTDAPCTATSIVGDCCCAGCCCRCGCRPASADAAMMLLRPPVDTSLPLRLSCCRHAGRSATWSARPNWHPGSAAALQNGATWPQPSAKVCLGAARTGIRRTPHYIYLILRAACCSLRQHKLPEGGNRRGIGRLLYQPTVLLASGSGRHC